MLNRVSVLTTCVLGAALMLSASSFAQSAPAQNAPQGWPKPAEGGRGGRGAAAKDKTPPAPAPKHSIAGLWANTREGNQAKGVQLHPNDGTPGNQPPYTPFGLQLYKSHKPLEGFNSVPPAQNNDPRVQCEPLGLPRANHYDLGVRIYQDDNSVAMLYQYDNRWRIIWTDGRPLPKLLDGGVEINGEYQEERWMGYSVGKWLDDTTLEVQTIGTMPEDRVWLDNTGRAISDQVHITETFKRVDSDTMQWSEVLDDPKVFTKPWKTMDITMKTENPRIDILTRYCSPKEIKDYNNAYGDSVSEK
jgi:hypothetical protein